MPATMGLCVLPSKKQETNKHQHELGSGQGGGRLSDAPASVLGISRNNPSFWVPSSLSARSRAEPAEGAGGTAWEGDGGCVAVGCPFTDTASTLPPHLVLVSDEERACSAPSAPAPGSPLLLPIQRQGTYFASPWSSPLVPLNCTDKFR